MLLKTFKRYQVLTLVLLGLYGLPLVAEEIRAEESEVPEDLAAISDPAYLENSPFFSTSAIQTENIEKVDSQLQSASDKVVGQMTTVITEVGKKQRNSGAALMKIYNDSKVLSESDYQMRRAAMETEDPEKDSLPLIRTALKDEAIATVGEMVTKDLEFFQSFKKGLDFSFDFGAMFGSKSASSSKRQPDNVRYGLVLKDVIQPEQAYAVAAVTSVEDEWNYAAKAKPVWDIEQVEAQGVKNPLKINIDESRYTLSPADDRSYYADDTDMPFNMVNAVTKFKTPSTQLKGNIKPRNFQNAQSLAGGALPPMELSLRQSENLYSLNYLTKGNFEKEKVTHVFRAPVYKQFGLKRILNEEFDSIETVAENILVSEQLPALSVHYLNQEERYLARFSYKKDASEISILAETPPDFDFSKDFGKKTGEKYKIDYKFNF